jgi:hypothetical protein
MDGITKSSIVLGPTLISLGISWWLHDQYRWRWSLLVPILLILMGVRCSSRAIRASPTGAGSDRRGSETPTPSSQITPCAIIASATLTKPATFAPST